MLVNQFAKTFLKELHGKEPDSFRKTKGGYVAICTGKIRDDLPLNAYWTFLYESLELINKEGSQANRWLVKLLYQIKIGQYKMVDIYNDEPNVRCDPGLDENDAVGKLRCFLLTYGVLSDKDNNEIALNLDLWINGKVNIDRTYKIKYELFVDWREI